MQKFQVIGLIMIFCLFQSSCQNQLPNVHLETEVSVKNNFSDEAINDLNRLVLYFDQKVFQKFPSDNNFKVSYFQFAKYMKEMADKGQMEVPIDDISMNMMLNSLNNPSVAAIWTQQKVYMTDLKDTVLQLSLKSRSQYITFLKQMASNNNLIKSYVEDVESTGDIGPIAVANVLNHFDQLDFLNPAHRLFIAIHYLSLAESTKGNKSSKKCDSC